MAGSIDRQSNYFLNMTPLGREIGCVSTEVIETVASAEKCWQRLTIGKDCHRIFLEPE